MNISDKNCITQNFKTMKRLFTLIIAAILMFSGSQLFAQTNFYLNLSGAIPTGDFADCHNDDGFALIDQGLKEGGAGLGFNVGLKMKYGIGIKGLGIITTIDGIYNGLNSNARDCIKDLENSFHKWDYVSITTPKYINIPIMAGINYTYNFNSMLGVYGEVASGLNFRFVTNHKIVLRDESVSHDYAASGKAEKRWVYKYQPSANFVWQIGGGLVLSNRFTIGLNYYHIGYAQVKAKITYKSTSSVTYPGNHVNHNENETNNFNGKKVSPSLIMVRFGYKF